MKKPILTKFTAIFSTIIIATISTLNVPLLTYANTTSSLLSAASTTSATSASTSTDTVEWPAAPPTSAGSAILIDADTGAILYDKDSHTKAYPASITKLMTGLLAIEKCSLDDVITFSQTAAKSVIAGVDANIATKVGEQYTVEQSLYALLLSSANEVAYGIAEHVAGSLASFTDMMNARAKELGALDTHFSNASGLSDPNHYTTAYDMAMIGRACFTNSTFLSIDSFVGNYKLGPTNLTPEVRTIHSTNLMFKGQQFYYQYCKGGKTGFTDESGFTLVSYAEKDGMRLICVVMKEGKADDRYIDTKALFEYGFNNFKKVSISNSDVSSLFNNSNYYSSKVYGNSTIDFSMDASYVDLPNAATLTDVQLSLDNSNTITNEETTKYDYSAKLNFTYNGNTIGSAKLLVNTKDSVIKSDSLPYLASDVPATPTSKKSLTINVKYLEIAVGLILCSSFIFFKVKHKHGSKRRRKYPKSKLHY